MLLAFVTFLVVAAALGMIARSVLTVRDLPGSLVGSAG